MTILVGETDRMLMLLNLVFSDRINPTEYLSVDELALFGCESGAELIEKIDSTLVFVGLNDDDDKRLAAGRYIIGQSMYYGPRQNLTGRQVVEQTISEREHDYSAGAFALVSHAVRVVVRFYETVVKEYHEPIEQMETALREAAALTPKDSPAYSVLAPYL